MIPSENNNQPQMQSAANANGNTEKGNAETLREIVADLRNLYLIFNEQLKKLSETFRNDKSSCEWEILADRLETFCLLFFLITNALVTIAFIIIGQCQI